MEQRAADPSPDTPPARPRPYDGEVLRLLAWKQYGRFSGGERRRAADNARAFGSYMDGAALRQQMAEDAVMEYVRAGLEAAAKDDGKGNIQAFQVASGTGAMLEFWRHERRRDKITPGECLKEKSDRISLDLPIKGMDGEPATLADTILDRITPRPCGAVFAKERHDRLRRAMAALPPLERDAFEAVVLDNLTQGQAAQKLGITRNQLRGHYDNAHRALFHVLADMAERYNPGYRPRPARDRSENATPPAPPPAD